MIVDNFDIIEILTFHAKTYSILIVDSNTVLSLTISVKQFKAIGWWDSQIIYVLSVVNHKQFS